MQDLTSAGISFELIAPELALMIAASIILLTGYIRNLGRLSASIGFLGLAAAMALAIGHWGEQGSGFSGMVTNDNFGMAFKVIAAGVSMLALLMAHRWLTLKGYNQPEFYALLLISTLGMMVMANSTDLVVLFIGLEVMSVPLYVMAAYAKRSPESNEAGIKYFAMGAFASAFLLMGIAFVYGAAGTTDLRRITSDLGFIIDQAGVFVYAGAALILIGFGFKVAAAPFHFWTPDVYQGAPTPVTAFFSVGPKAAGFAALLRVFLYGFEAMDVLAEVFWVLAVITMTVGNVLALRQNNIKRMLAYSSIAHAGYILIALAVGGTAAVSAAVFYLVAYAFFNLGGFAVVTLLESRSGGTAEFRELAGLAKAHPYLAVVLALFMFALAGFPPTVGFFGKFYLFSAAVQGGYIWLAVIGVMNSFISVYYYLRVVKASYFEAAPATTEVAYSPSMVVVLVVTAVGTLGLGFFPQQVLAFSQKALFLIM